MSQQIRHELSKSVITLTRMYVAEFQKEGSITAELRQEVTTKSFYPSKRIDSNLQDNMFGTEEFGYDEQEFTSVETRMAWIIIPIGTPEAEVAKRIAAANANGASIYRVLSNEPILDDNQKYSIVQGLRTKDQFANSQVVRYPENHATKPNELILDKAGNPQYRRTFFWKTAKADMDLRDASKVYMSPEIAAELEGASAVQGQTL